MSKSQEDWDKARCTAMLIRQHLHDIDDLLDEIDPAHWDMCEEEVYAAFPLLTQLNTITNTLIGRLTPYWQSATCICTNPDGPCDGPCVSRDKPKPLRPMTKPERRGY